MTRRPAEPASKLRSFLTRTPRRRRVTAYVALVSQAIVLVSMTANLVSSFSRGPGKTLLAFAFGAGWAVLVGLFVVFAKYMLKEVRASRDQRDTDPEIKR